MAGRTVGQWNDLSEAYRARLTRTGITREGYLAGDSLMAARGHTPAPPPTAAPAGPTLRETIGEGGPEDLSILERWSRPSWIPSDMSPPTAAALSQLDVPPSKWGHVHFTPRGDEQPWDMTVTVKGSDEAHARTIQIPGGGGAGTWGAREVLDWFAYGDDDDLFDIDYDVGY